MQEEEDRGRTDVARNERENSGILGSENGDRGRATEEGERGQRGERERERGARGRVRGWPVARVPTRVRE